MSKVWIEILTPKQVMLFGRLKKELEHRGFDVFATTRRYRETNWLLELHSVDARMIGRHGGPTLEGKMAATLERMQLLYKVIEKEKPDVSASLCSPEAARISFGLGIKHICINDIPEAEAQSRLSVPLASIVVSPKIIPKEVFVKYGISEDRIVQYDALDPRAWLYDFKPDECVFKELGIEKDKLTITFRTEETFAAYLNGNGKGIVVPVVEKLLAECRDANFVVLPRYEEQEETIRKKFNGQIIVPHRAIDGPSLLKYSSIFIGGGGTMTIESALLGTPTIACRSIPTMYEKYVIEKGLAYKSLKVGEIVEKTKEILSNNGHYRKQQEETAKKMMEKMQDPLEVIIRAIEKNV